MITAEHIERAERILRQTYSISIGDPRIVIDRARAERDAVDKFVSHHRERLFKEYIPDVDPRLEAPLMTMMLHFFAVGAISQRVSEGRS
jgi:hypothetical protein